MSKRLKCIYHGNCQDGFGAAWAVRRLFGDGCEYLPAFYGKEPPDVSGCHVIMVDFSYKRPVLEAMSEKAESILILDHHASAERELAGFPQPEGLDGPLVWLPDSGVFCLFDMDRSGAGIAWDYFEGRETARPQLLNHIEDRDLWRFKLEGTREISQALFSHDYDFEIWDDLMATTDFSAMIAEGTGIHRKLLKDCRELIKVCQRYIMIADVVVPVASLPYTYTSEAGNIMAEETGAPFAACYFDTPETRVFSLRSCNGGLDVSKIAERFGGGGHRNAAGFEVPRDHPLASA